jgi:hypothetical protein
MKLSDHFDSDEFRCPCQDCRGIEPIVAPELVSNLEKLRAILNADLKPGDPEHGLTINSGCRCPARNKIDGGAKASQHLYDPATGKASHAADVYCRTRPTREVYEAALTVSGFKGIGLGAPQAPVAEDKATGTPARPGKPGYVHLDVRPTVVRVQWGYGPGGGQVELARVLPHLDDWNPLAAVEV